MYLLSIVYVSHERHHLLRELLESIPRPLLAASFLHFSVFDNSAFFPPSLCRTCKEYGISVYLLPRSTGSDNFRQYKKLPPSRFLLFFHDDDVVHWSPTLLESRSISRLFCDLSGLSLLHYYYPKSFYIYADTRAAIASPAYVSEHIRDPRRLPPYPGLIYPCTFAFVQAFEKSLSRPLGKYSDIYLQLSLIRCGITPKMIDIPFFHLFVLQHSEQDSAMLEFLDFVRMWSFSLCLRSDPYYFPVFFVHFLSALKRLILQHLRRLLSS